MLISVTPATAYTRAMLDGIARPATRSGMPAATTDANTRTRITAAIGSETISARCRSRSDCSAESMVIGP